MNRKRIISCIILSVIFISVGFGIGYLTGKSVHTKDSISAEPQTNKTVSTYNSKQLIQNTPSPIPTVVSSYYLLKNENEVLTLYEISGNNSAVIKTININSSVLPYEDREKLKSGIKLSSKEEGFNLIEDFTS
ncbi:MAG: hypothetical protein SOZ34_03550 [Clostridia bacterium]|nr:hypothetical protein [Clostridia bacterium]